LKLNSSIADEWSVATMLNQGSNAGIKTVDSFQLVVSNSLNKMNVFLFLASLELKNWKLKTRNSKLIVILILIRAKIFQKLSYFPLLLQIGLFLI